MIGLGYGYSFGARRGGRSAFTPLDIASTVAWYQAEDGPQKTGPAPAGDGETIATVLDSSGNGNTLTRTAASTALVLDADGGPNGGPAIIGTGGALSRTFAAPIASPWVAMVVRLDWAGGASLIVDSSATNRYYVSRYTSTLLSINSGTTVNNNAVVDGEWGLLIVDWGTAGAFNWSGQLEKIINSGSNGNAGFVFGRAYNDITPTNFALADLIVGDGTLTRADRIKLRAWAARKYDLEFPSDTLFLDTFERADTVDSNIGLSDSGHAWTGLGTSGRLLDGKLTYVSPWNTVYAAPSINFVPRVIDYDFTTRAGGGGGGQTFAVILIGTGYGDYDPCVHFTFEDTGWSVQEFEGAAITIIQSATGKNYGGGGRFRLTVNYDAGTITVLDPDDVETVVPWDASGLANHDLSYYQHPYVFCEVIGDASTAPLVYEFDRVQIQA